MDETEAARVVKEFQELCRQVFSDKTDKRLTDLEKRVAALEVEGKPREITLQLDGAKAAKMVTPPFVEEISRAVGESVACSLKWSESELHKLTIKGNILALDGFELKGVTEYGVKGSFDTMTELSLKMMIEV